MRNLGLHTKFDGYLRNLNSNLNLNSNYCEKKFPSVKFLFRRRLNFPLKKISIFKNKKNKTLQKKNFSIFYLPFPVVEGVEDDMTNIVLSCYFWSNLKQKNRKLSLVFFSSLITLGFKPFEAVCLLFYYCFTYDD